MHSLQAGRLGLDYMDPLNIKQRRIVATNLERQSVVVTYIRKSC